MQKTIDGVTLGYDDAGSGETIVLLHGFLLDRTIWHVTGAALALRRRVIALDLRGSGESGRGEGPALMETLAGDVYGLLDALGIERAIVAGHDLGGYVALAFFRMYAERVAGLALIASGIGADSAARRADRTALAGALATRGIDAAVDWYLPRAFGAGTAPDSALVTQVRALVTRQAPAGAAAQLAGMQQRLDSSDLLEDIAVPATIVAGERDAWAVPAEDERAAAAIAGCTFMRLPRCGHVPMLEAPEPMSGALEALALRCATLEAARRSARAGRA